MFEQFDVSLVCLRLFFSNLEVIVIEQYQLFIEFVSEIIVPNNNIPRGKIRKTEREHIWETLQL